jgi:hypothetical protein
VEASIGLLKVATEQQSQQALELIDSVAPAALATNGPVGTRLHVVA